MDDRSRLTSVADFDVPGYCPGASILVLGISPTLYREKPKKNATCNVVSRWMELVGAFAWDFHNVVPDVENCSKMALVDVEALLIAQMHRRKIVALGGFVSRVCERYNVPHYRIDHPSGRNHNLNDKDYRVRMLIRLHDYLWDGAPDPAGIVRIIDGA